MIVKRKMARKKIPAPRSPAGLDALRIAAVASYWKATGKRACLEPLSDAERDEARDEALIMWGPIPEQSKTRGVPSGTALDALLVEGMKQSEASRRWLAAHLNINPLVRKGKAFAPGKPKGAFGPLRKLVRTMLARKGNRSLPARELWEACAALPEKQRRGIDFETESNAYVPGQGNVSFRRFANIVSEERKRPK